MEEGSSEDVPEYILPLFFTTQTQEIFQCKGDEQITEESPYKLIAKEQILQDYRDRAAISDFHPARKIVQKYPADELLIVYDPAFKFGQNFYLITNEEQKQLILNPPESAAAEEHEELGEENGEARPGIIAPKPWVSLGSEQEIADEVVMETREKMKFTISRERRLFGRYIEFSDRDEDEAKDVVIECLSYDDNAYKIKMKELDKAIQHIAETKNSECQTVWPCPRNSNVQFEPRENTEEQNEKIMKSDEMMEFIAEVIPRFELALQQNETIDVFSNDYLNLCEEDGTFGSNSDNHLKEYQSFTDLKFSKNKTISDIQWHPTIKGLVAVSCMEHMSFYERVDYSSKCLMTPSLILIWSFADPIHPLLLLEAPDDILCFQFNPSDPNILCGGCINGQVVLWDITKYSEHLHNHQTQSQGTNANQNLTNMPMFFNSAAPELSPIIRYCTVSSIENSHRMSVSHIQWVPDHIEIGRMGIVIENKSNYCSQIMTCSGDGTVLFWDTKSTKSAGVHLNSVSDINMDRITTFQHLDLSWKPLQKVTVQRIRGSGEYSPVKFMISEVQGTVKRTAAAETADDEVAMENQYSFKKKEEAKQLDYIDTKFHVVTEDGELVYLDWKHVKDIETGKITSARPEFCICAHDCNVNTLQKSPFIKDIFLTVGGWTFAIWKEGITYGPLFQSYAHVCKLTSAHWSPSRPGVFFIGKADGNIDVWDLMDKTHEPFLTQNVTPVPVMAVFPYQISGKQQLLAAGDEVGTLHIMEVPWNLRHSSNNEQSIIENYLEREANRLNYIENRRSGPLGAGKGTAAVGGEQTNEVPAQLDEEWEVKAKIQYMEYLDLEKQILQELGLLKEDDL